jgi:uncharacterized protein YjbI with pentapeptide repeats
VNSGSRSVLIIAISGHSSFYNTKIKKTVFKSSQLEEVDFTDCDLMNSSFEIAKSQKQGLKYNT